MPARKSTASASAQSIPSAIGDVSILSTTSAAGTEPKSPTAHKGGRQSTSGGGTGDAEVEKPEKKKVKNDDLGIDDLLLPRTLTSRLSRGTLPPNTSIQRDALLALTKSATVFISYLAHNANNLTSRKTIQSQDILEALRETELWNVPVGNGEVLGDRVRAEVEKWEGEVRGKRKGYRDRVKARESTGTVGADGDGDEGMDGEDRGPVNKRARRTSDPDVDITMDGDDDNDNDDEDEDAAAAQLRGEVAAANDDETETDPEAAEDEDEQDEEGYEEDQDEDEREDGDADDDDDQERDRLDIDDSRRQTTLAPNGRWEEEDDDRDDSD